jgi:hypothetical protein
MTVGVPDGSGVSTKGTRPLSNKYSSVAPDKSIHTPAAIVSDLSPRLTVPSGQADENGDLIMPCNHHLVPIRGSGYF